jgi:hypothetical protein
MFELFRGGPDETLLARIGRDSSRDEFYADDPEGIRIVQGTLDWIMITIDALARTGRRDPAA